MKMLQHFHALVLAVLFAASFRLAAAEETVLFDYESKEQPFEQADQMEYVPDHATQGKLAGKVVLNKPFLPNFFFYGGSNQAGKWGEYDQLVYDVFVEGGNVRINGFVRDKGGMGWDKRHNFEVKLTPGKHRLAFSLGSFMRENGTGPLDLKTIDFFAITFNSEDPKTPATLYLDNTRLVKGTGSFEVKMLAGFEGADKVKLELEDYPDEFKGKSSMGPVAEHATEGKQALKLESHAPAGNVQFSGFDADWSSYDTLAFDIFNPGDKPVQIAGWVKAKDVNAGWDKRYNYERMLKPGMNTVRLSIGSMSGPDGGKMIDVKDIKKFNICADKATIYIDNVRLIKGVEEIPVAGLKKFDCGPANSAVMPGFTKITKDTAYNKGQGFGWMPGGTFGRDFDINEMLGRHRPVDDLCRDFCQVLHATFAVDVPDGTYSVWLMFGPPGNGWGPFFHHRSVSANGKVVVDQNFTQATFKEYEYHFQDAEDLPGDDLFEKYITFFFKAQRFDVEVKGGQLTLEIDGGGEWWSAMLNGFVLWPKASEKDAERWLANFEGFRKDQYLAQHVETVPDAPAPFAPRDEDKARGFIPFAHALDRVIEVNSQPSADEAKRTSLDLAGSPNETVSACFGLVVLKDLGALDNAVCTVKSADGKELTADVRALRYKALNRESTYKISPKYLDEIVGHALPLKAGITRSIWVTLQIPAGTAPGEYTGELKLSGPQFKEYKVPVKLTVWPLALADIDFPMGIFMMSPVSQFLAFDPNGAESAKAWKELLEDAKAHGITSVDPSISLPLQRFANGKAEIDFSSADRFMELARAAGFTQELLGYALNRGFRMTVPVDMDAEAKKFGAPSYGELAKAYFDAIREHAKAKNWLPICYCTDDEYIAHTTDSLKLAELHRVLQQAAPDFHFVALDTAYFDGDAQHRAEREQTVSGIDTWSPGLHSQRDEDIVMKAGHRLWLYNTGMNRFTFGSYMYFARTKHHVTGFFQWVYPTIGTCTNFYLASYNEAHYGVVYPSTHGLRASTVWEWIRAGCNDHRYLETATKLLAQAQASGKGAAEAKALKDLIDTALGKLAFGKANADAISGEGKANNPFSPENMEAFHRNVAEALVKLQAALK